MIIELTSIIFFVVGIYFFHFIIKIYLTYLLIYTPVVHLIVWFLYIGSKNKKKGLIYVNIFLYLDFFLIFFFVQIILFFRAVFFTQILFIFLQIDKFINWNWNSIFIPCWITLIILLIYIFGLFILIVCTIYYSIIGDADLFQRIILLFILILYDYYA